MSATARHTLVSAAAACPGTRVLNAVDPEAPSVGHIVDAIARHLGHAGRVVRIADEGRHPATLGRTPWSVPAPRVYSTAAAAALGYRPSTTYAEALPALCDAGEDRAPAAAGLA